VSSAKSTLLKYEPWRPMPTLELSRIVVGAALIGMKMLRGLMWLVAIAVVGCVVATALGQTSTVVSLGDSNAKRLAPSAVPNTVSVRLLQTPETLYLFRYDQHRGV
jgi:hypothetical protein